MKELLHFSGWGTDLECGLITNLKREPIFMSPFDSYSHKLLTLFQAKKGVVGVRHCAQMNIPSFGYYIRYKSQES